MDIVLATCSHLPELTASDRLLRDALMTRGAVVSSGPWETIRPDYPTRVCLRSTWDYHRRPEEFSAWVGQFLSRPGALWNPPELVQWNLDKIYLLELAALGIAIPATEWIAPGTRPALAGLLRRLGWPRAVLKPRISATAHGTHLVTAETELTEEEWEAVARTGALLQVFLPEVQTAGEISLVFLAGRYRHAARKLPGGNDFRVQHDFGGSATPAVPGPAVVRFAERIMAAVSSPWLYSRVDVIETAEGPILMELELIEPDLFFNLAPSSADALAEGLLAGAIR